MRLSGTTFVCSPQRKRFKIVGKRSYSKCRDYRSPKSKERIQKGQGRNCIPKEEVDLLDKEQKSKL